MLQCKKLYGGEIFQNSNDFPPGLLPTKRQVIECKLNFNHFRKLDSARIVAKELHNRWIWCDVYSIHELYQLMLNLRGLTRYPKKFKTFDGYIEFELVFCMMLTIFLICFAVMTKKESNVQFNMA